MYGNGAVITIPNSQSGAIYQLRNGFVNESLPKTGNGGTLEFISTAALNDTTTFNVIATISNSCFTDSLIVYRTISTVSGGGLVPACIPTGNNGWGIVQFVFNNINNSSSAASGYYFDYSCHINDSLIAGTTYPISITTAPSISGSTEAWIDFNNSGTFTSNEMVSSQGNITIPYSVVYNVPLRMRIVCSTGGLTNTTSCGVGFYNGEYEDYAVTIYHSPIPPVAVFSMNITNGCFATATFTNTTVNGDTYFWDFGDGDTSTAFNPTHIYTTSGTYTVTLITTNGFGSDTASQSVTVQNNVAPLPAVCNPTSQVTSCDRIFISNMQINGILSNNSSNSSSAPFYDDFTCIYQINLQRDSSYTMHIGIRNVNNSCVGMATAFIDYNNDGAFNNTNERLILGAVGGCNILVPLLFPALQLSIPHCVCELKP